MAGGGNGLTMREAALDTETTGLDPLEGHRIVEIGELISRSPTGQTFHRCLCPQRTIPADAVAVHGLTAGSLYP
jgi:DNA polymerase III subunit epsilon